MRGMKDTKQLPSVEKPTISEMKHSIDEFNRLGTSEKRSENLKILQLQLLKIKDKKGNKAKKRKSLSDLWDNIR